MWLAVTVITDPSVSVLQAAVFESFFLNISIFREGCVVMSLKVHYVLLLVLSEFKSEPVRP